MDKIYSEIVCTYDLSKKLFLKGSTKKIKSLFWWEKNPSNGKIELVTINQKNTSTWTKDCYYPALTFCELLILIKPEYVGFEKDKKYWHVECIKSTRIMKGVGTSFISALGDLIISL